MANWKLILLTAALPTAVIAHANVKSKSGAGGAAVNIYDAMHNHVVPQAQVIWDITNMAMDDDGNPSEKKMKAADWKRLMESTAALSASLNRIASAKALTVRLANQKLLDEDLPAGAKAATVQHNINQNSAGFRQYAKALAQYVNRMNRAADRRDIKSISEMASELDGQCEGCHETYWFGRGKS